MTSDLFFQQLIGGVLLLFFVVLALLIALGISVLFFYGAILYFRIKKREMMSLGMVTVEVRVPKDNEIKIDAAEQMFASLTSLHKPGKFAFSDVGDVIAFEIVARHADIRFYVTIPEKILDLVEKQMYAFYPNADIKVVDEPSIFTEQGKVAFAAMRTDNAPYQPIKLYKELPTDPLAGVTSALSKMGEHDGAIIQILIRATKSKWKKAGKSYISSTKKKEASPDEASFKIDPKTLEKIDEKTQRPGFDAVVRIVVSSENEDAAKQHLGNIKASFSQFASDLNSFTGCRNTFKGSFMVNFIYKFFPIVELPFHKSVSVLTSDELATIYHFPNKTVETPHIRWLKAKTAPVAAEVPKSGGTYIGHGHYRGVRREVHIGANDRRRHVYIIGKTGTGKSELLLDMANQDIRQGQGVCVIDPHGDLIENILKFIPPERAEDVIYFDPSDDERPLGVNFFEAKNEQQKHLISTSIINLMYKLYDPQRTGIIGPRFEHAVRNAMLSVMYEEGSTFIEVMRILQDPKYVNELLPKIDDPIVRRYWTDQIAQTSDFHKSEVLDYIVSKFGRFVTNILMRNIIGQSKSAFDMREVMDTGKILLINLSKGKLGEENSNFLGLILIPKILIAAMSRQDIPEDQRRDFNLYVDEFQNFATPDFATILSEARKYHLNLTVANQFIGQVDEEVKNAVFGNVGSIICFRVGVTDASYLSHEFQPVFGESDLINVDRYNAFMKTIVDNEPVAPFSVDLTKDMAKMKAMSNDKIASAVVQLSRLKFGKPKELVEAEIAQRSRL